MANYSFLTDNINIASTVVASNAVISDRMYANGYFYANGAPIISNVFSDITVTGNIIGNSIVSNGSIFATSINSSGSIFASSINSTGSIFGSSVNVSGSIFASTVNVSSISTPTGNLITFPATTGALITSNDFGTITNSMLANSNVRINGTAVSLGSSYTLSSLTLGSGLTGTSYNGSTPVSTGIDATVVATLSGSQNLTNKIITSLANSSTILDFSGNAWQFGFRNMPQSTTSSGNLALGDSGKHLYVSSGITVPPNSSVPFEIGTVVTLVSNATSLTITQGSGVTLKWANSSSTGNRTLASNGIATLLKVAIDTWYIFGLGLT